MNLLFALFFLFVATPLSAGEGGIDPLYRRSFLKGYEAYQDGKWDRTVKILSPLKEEMTPIRDYLLYYLGNALLKEGGCQEARLIFRGLVEGEKESRWVPAVEAQLRGEDPCHPLPDGGPPVRRLVCEAVASLPEKANCFFSARLYQEARDLYGHLVSQPYSTGRQLFYLARLSQSASRSEDSETAIRANEEIRRLRPGTKASSDALRKIAFLHKDRGDFQKAIPLFRKLLGEEKTRGRRRSVWQEIGWSHYRLRHYREAAEAFRQSRSEEDSPFALYWEGVSRRKGGEKKEASRLFREVIERYPRGYYALRAAQRLGILKKTLRVWWPDRKKIRWERAPLAIPEEDPLLEKIRLLRRLELNGEAAIELRRWRVRSGLSVGLDLRGEVRRPIDEDPDYPIPHASFLREKAKGLDIDPMFVFAMMRQESRFSERAVSGAGALGLLQLMPETAWRTADSAGWTGFDPDWLYEPLTNIELALLYLGKIRQEVGKQWYGVVASYSAGEQPVAAWLKMRKGLAPLGLSEEEFIEEIPYAETRDYVKKVYANWQAYRWIYR